MAYLGRKGASAPLTSADIPAGSVSAVKVASDVATQAELDAQKTNSSITTLGTVTAGNISHADIVYPAGHQINQSVVNVESRSGTITCAATSYTDLGLEVNIVTKATSANSYLIFEYYGGMFYTPAAVDGFGTQVTMRTVSNSTYTSGETVTTATYPTYIVRGHNNYETIFIRTICGLGTGMGMPATKSSWAIGDTLYFRMFAKGNNTTSTAFVHDGSTYSLVLTEVAR